MNTMTATSTKTMSATERARNHRWRAQSARALVELENLASEDSLPVLDWSVGARALTGRTQPGRSAEQTLADVQAWAEYIGAISADQDITESENVDETVLSTGTRVLRTTVTRHIKGWGPHPSPVPVSVLLIAEIQAED